MSRLPVSGRFRLVLLSMLMLFVELGLIRYSAENVIYLAFFSNLVLIASFLGIGIGFLRGGSGGDGNGLRRAPLALAGMVLFFVLLPALQVDKPGQDVEIGGLFGLPALPGWVMVPLIFLATAFVMALIAEGVAETFARFEPLEAYRLDILGSVIGIALFSGMAFLGAPPLVWALICAAGFAAALGPSLRWLPAASLAVLVLLLGVVSFWPNAMWSPYYRLDLRERDDGVLSISANSRPHQSITPIEEIPERRPFYLFPYDYKPEPGKVLIIGAGSGTDVAVALSKGAEHVDAVEIDPRLYEIGLSRNPMRPYEDPRVSVHINDGRAFLERTEERYDLIMLALPDSLTLVGGQGSLRLENFLFTREAVESMKEHLAPGGVFSMYNYYGPVAFGRNSATIREVFGTDACVDLGESGAGTRQMASLTVALDQPIECARFAEASTTTELATDDHPFPYMAGRAIPRLYIITALLVLLVSVVAVRRTSGPLRQMSGYLDLFFMGAAFLLLETMSVVRFALLFGTTWLVNALVFTGVLLAVLGAVWLAMHVRLPRPWVLYAVLIAALTLAWFIPASFFLSLAFWPRFFMAILVAFAPIFLANLVFAQRFKDVESPTMAFGANLLGAMVGGVLEYSAMIIGYRSLLIMVAVLYGAAWFTGRHHLREPSPRPKQATLPVPASDVA